MRLVRIGVIVEKGENEGLRFLWRRENDEGGGGGVEVVVKVDEFCGGGGDENV